MRNRIFIVLTVISFGLFVVAALPALLGRPDAVAALEKPQAAGQRDQRATVQAAALWLIRAHQNDDGGYADFSAGANQSPSTVGGTLDAILALSSLGYPVHTAFPGERSSPMDFLASDPQSLAEYAAENGGQAGKLILALTAANEDPRSFLGHNFVISLTQQLRPSGQFNADDVFKQSLAMLALASVNETVPGHAVRWIKSKQATNGSWDDGFGTVDSADATAMAVMALVAAGVPSTDSSLAIAREFLAGSQLPSGGWEYGPGLGESAVSTALVIQALEALGEPWFEPGGEWSKNGNTPLQVLLAWQSANGAFQSDFGQGRFDDFYTTVQSLPAAAGKAYPLPSRSEAARRALSCLDRLQDVTTGGWEQFAGGGEDAAGISRALQAIAAAGSDPLSERWTTVGGTSAPVALENLTPAFLSEGRGGRVGIVMQGVAAAGEPYNVGTFAGFNLPLTMSGFLSPTGEYDSTAFGLFAHAEAMLGLIAAGQPVAREAVDVVYRMHTGGDWGDPDSSGMALHILGRMGLPAPAGATNALRDGQMPDGGWGYDGVSNPNSTSEVVQGLTAIGQNPFSPTWSRVVSGTLSSPADSVMAGQRADGCWPNLYGPGADPYATTDAVLLLTRRPSWGLR